MWKRVCRKRYPSLGPAFLINNAEMLPVYSLTVALSLSLCFALVKDIVAFYRLAPSSSSSYHSTLPSRVIQMARTSFDSLADIIEINLPKLQEAVQTITSSGKT